MLVIWRILGWTLGLLALGVWGKSSNQMADKSSAILAEYNRENNASLFWGPYRSNLYFGVRPRVPHGLMTGLMWFNSDSYEGLNHIRHACDQRDEMAGYGWTQYDPRMGGTQTIKDNRNKVQIDTEFVKRGDNWAVRVKGKPYDNDQNAVTALVMYMGLEGGGMIDLENMVSTEGIYDNPIRFSGFSNSIGQNFEVNIRQSKKNKYPKSGHVAERTLPPDLPHFITFRMPDDEVWKAKDFYLTFVQDHLQVVADKYLDDNLPPWCAFTLNNRLDMKGNIYLVQFTFKGDFEVEMIYDNQDGLQSQKEIAQNSLAKRRIFNDQLDSAKRLFLTKLDHAFVFQPPFENEEYYEFAQEMMSNLLGGIGYFYGKQIVNRAESDETTEFFWENTEDIITQEEGPYELFSTVPSRPFFPRGFYWDEGFNLIPVLDYDADLALEMIKSWFALVDSDGWIAREQILGPEARSKVPSEFQVQNPHIANPPTLMLLFSEIARRAIEAKKSLELQSDGEQKLVGLEFEPEIGFRHYKNPSLFLRYAKQIYPYLQNHYEWFRESQKGAIRQYEREAFSKKEGYRWRGRTPDHCLASGLDDYPRASMPHPGELHVDLLSWIGMMTRSMRDIASIIGQKEDVEAYTQIDDAIVRNLEDLHWNSEEKSFCDLTVDEYEESQFECHKGYVSLMPFFVKLLSGKHHSEQLKAILDTIHDPEQLWSSFGIRSLSMADEYFGTKENYWRGPVWINMNYMALDALMYYHEDQETPLALKSQIKEIYTELRQNIVSNIFDNWKSTGFAWEQYDSATGKGQGVKHFLGWTALVVKIMAMPQSL